MILKRISIFCLLLLSVLPLLVQAHTRSESFSEWAWQNNHLSYSFSVLQREASRIPFVEEGAPLGEVLAGYLNQTLSVRAADEPCTVAQPATALPARGGFLRVEGRFICSQAATPEIQLKTFFEYVPTHTHYAKLRITDSVIQAGASDEGRISEFLFTHGQQTRLLRSDFQQEQSSWQAFTEYVWIGAEHILGGIDHLAFVMALLLLATGLKEIAWLITGFTLGHSLSLVLAVLKLAEPNSLMVEALIGFTIALVVVEACAEKTNSLPSMARWILFSCLALLLPVLMLSRKLELVIGVMGIGVFSFCYFQLQARADSRSVMRVWVTLVFGVVHGFGFAGGLLEAEFASEKVALVLLGFNLGVELGQLLVLAVVIGLMALARQRLPNQLQQRFGNFTMMCLGGLGTFWFISRLLA